MQRVLKQVALFWLLSAGAALCQQPSPIATWKPDKPGAARYSHPLFLADDLLVFESCDSFSSCRTSVLKITDRGFEKVSSGGFERGDVVRGSDNSFLVPTWGEAEPGHFTRRMMTIVDATSLKSVGLIPEPASISPAGQIFLTAEIERKSPTKEVNWHWNLYRLNSSVEPVLIRSGEGWHLALSNNRLVRREKNTIITETLEGQRLGSFNVDPRSKEQWGFHLLDETKILMVGKSARVVDFDGNELSRVTLPRYAGGLSFSTKGDRMLWDEIVRKRSFLQRVWDIARFLPTLGVYEDGEYPTAEVARVIDTKTGAKCFEWIDYRKDLSETGNPDETKSSLSPSGKKIAIFQAGTLYLYALPDVCPVT